MGTAAVSLYFSAKNVNNVDQGVMLRAVPNGSRIRIHKATDSSIYSLWQTTSAGRGTLENSARSDGVLKMRSRAGCAIRKPCGWRARRSVLSARKR
jgi:hypothetical protein